MVPLHFLSVCLAYSRATRPEPTHLRIDNRSQSPHPARYPLNRPDEVNRMAVRFMYLPQQTTIILLLVSFIR